MKLENAYLSEEELEQLILQVEELELVTAPPDLEDKILLCSEPIQEDMRKETRNKNTEFRRYCFRVITSAAAAIAIIFGLPHMEVKPKVKVLSRQEVLKAGITREEVLNDTKMFSKVLNDRKDMERLEDGEDK